ncbi:phage tail assembly chaperone [Pseudomonas sp. NPDC090755]|uniref:phage tail assembly chaperone n=1 Tax=Pseudomonas sp. NPDC090755 TaxID=3364481 RepID=UPI00383BCA07
MIESNTKWAHVSNGKVLEVTDTDPVGRFHPSILWLSCGGVEVDQGWHYVNEVFLESPIDEQSLADAERMWRDSVLDATEWLVARHRDEQLLARETTLTPEQHTELLACRQSLRDWPQSESFPNSDYRPPVPHWIAEPTH